MSWYTGLARIGAVLNVLWGLVHYNAAYGVYQFAQSTPLTIEYGRLEQLAFYLASREPLRCEGCQPEGSRRYRPIHAGDRQLVGLADPFDPMESLRHSAEYLRELLNRFGNLGLAAAAYNAGPTRVSAWLTSHRPLPGETRNYVALVTGWTADEWASSSPPEKADTTIPQGVPCTRLANLILAPKQERQRIAAYIPRWGIQLAAHLSESTAWAIYRDRLKRFGSLIGDREPIVLHKEIPGMGRVLTMIGPHWTNCARS